LPTKFPEETWPKTYLGQDLDVFKSQIGMRIQNIAVQITEETAFYYILSIEKLQMLKQEKEAGNI
jgi:hypothetical protein